MWLQASLAELPFLEIVCFASSPLGFAQTYVLPSKIHISQFGTQDLNTSCHEL